jgi:hypothetical protein
MTFGETYSRLLEGYKIRRKSWAEGDYVRLPYPGAKHFMFCTRGQVCTIWTPKIDDLLDLSCMQLVNDWHVIK